MFVSSILLNSLNPHPIFCTRLCFHHAIRAASGASGGGFSKIIPSKSCQRRWRSVSCQRVEAHIEPVVVKRHRTLAIFGPIAGRYHVDRTMLAIDFVAVVCQKVGAVFK